MSLICPAVCHGSLVTRTSPASSLSGGNAARKCFIEVAMALIWPGVPLSDCAIMRPLVSNRPQAKSWLSRTIVLNAVRISASCCSFATDMKRFQITSNVTGSIALCFIAQLRDNVETFIDLRTSAHADDQGRLALLDNRRTVKLHSGFERVTVIDRGVNKAAVFRKICRARAFARLRSIRMTARQHDFHWGSRSTRYDP